MILLLLLKGSMILKADLWELKSFGFGANKNKSVCQHQSAQCDGFTKVTINRGCVYFNKLWIMA